MFPFYFWYFIRIHSNREVLMEQYYALYICYEHGKVLNPIQVPSKVPFLLNPNTHITGYWFLLVHKF